MLAQLIIYLTLRLFNYKKLLTLREKNDRYTLLSDLQAYIVANIVRKENPDAKLNLVKAN